MFFKDNHIFTHFSIEKYQQYFYYYDMLNQLTKDIFEKIEMIDNRYFINDDQKQEQENKQLKQILKMIQLFEKIQYLAHPDRKNFYKGDS